MPACSPRAAAARASLAADPGGSTLRTTWRDPRGTGTLVAARRASRCGRAPSLGPRARTVGVLATLAHLTDAHVLDAQSPARVTFLDRLGGPFQSTFRPQETLTAQVLAGALHAVRALRPDAVIQGGDLIDNDQANELAHALAVLNGGTVSPGSGGRGYFGVQSAVDADPFYYRPDLDAPAPPGSAPGRDAPVHEPGRRPRLASRCSATTTSLSRARSRRRALTRALAVGDQAVWDLPPGLTRRARARGGGAERDRRRGFLARRATRARARGPLPRAGAGRAQGARAGPTAPVASSTPTRCSTALRAASANRAARTAARLQRRRRQPGSGARARPRPPRWRLGRTGPPGPAGVARRRARRRRRPVGPRLLPPAARQLRGRRADPRAPGPRSARDRRDLRARPPPPDHRAAARRPAVTG